MTTPVLQIDSNPAGAPLLTATKGQTVSVQDVTPGPAPHARNWSFIALPGPLASPPTITLSNGEQTATFTTNGSTDGSYSLQCTRTEITLDQFSDSIIIGVPDDDGHVLPPAGGIGDQYGIGGSPTVSKRYGWMGGAEAGTNFMLDAFLRFTKSTAKTALTTVQNPPNVHPPVLVATVAALPTNSYNNSAGTITGSALGALPPIDGVTLSVTSPLTRILVKDEPGGISNGYYVVTQLGDGSHPFILTRAPDANVSSLVSSSMAVTVQSGSTNSSKTFVLVSQPPITLGSTALTFIQQGTKIDARVIAKSDGSTDDLANLQGALLAAPTVVYSKGSGAYKIGSNGTLGSWGTGQFHEFASGAIIHIPAGVTLTMYGDIKAGNAQRCFQVDAGGTLLHVPDSGPMVSAYWYGAVGDANPNSTGTGTDSTIGLQTALNAAGQLAGRTGTVYLPGGNYRVTSTLNVPGGVKIVGDGNYGNEVGSCIQYEGANGTDCIQIRATPNSASANVIDTVLISRTLGYGGNAIYIQAWIDGGTTRRPSNVQLTNALSFAVNPLFDTGSVIVGLGLQTTISAGSDGVVLATGSISDVQVASTAGLPTPGAVNVKTTAGYVSIRYTGVGTSPTRLTGCTVYIPSTYSTPTIHTGYAVLSPYRFDRGLYMDGSLLDTLGARGIRATTLFKTRFGDCIIKNETVRLSQVSHLESNYLEVDGGPTNLYDVTAVGMTIDNGGATESVDVFLYGTEINGNLVLAATCRDTIFSGEIAGDLTVDASCSGLDLAVSTLAGNVTINNGASGSLRGRWAANPGTAFVGPPLTSQAFVIQVANAPLSCDGMKATHLKSVTTTDGFAETVDTITMADDTTIFVTMQAVARDTGNDDSASWTQQIAFKCISGTTSFVGGATMINLHQLDSNPASNSWNATLGVTGNTVTTAVVGSTGRTAKWTVKTTVEALA